MLYKTVFTALLFLVTGLGYRSDIHSQGNSKPITPSQNVMASKDIKVALKLLQSRSDGWEFELAVSNEGKLAVYLMTDPTQTDGTKGPYLYLDEDDSSTLKISSRVYPPPCFFDLYKNAAGVKLMRLEASSNHVERFSVKFPLRETMPPYGISPERKQIDPGSIEYIVASIGILPDEEGIKELLQKKPAGPFVNGLERVNSGAFKGKYLIETQIIVRSNIIKL